MIIMIMIMPDNDNDNDNDNDSDGDSDSESDNHNPLLKNPDFEMVNENFRPIRNLQFTSKLTEKAVAVQLQTHMLTNGLFLEIQSAYREHNSTETASLKVKNDILMNMDMGHVTLLVLF